MANATNKYIRFASLNCEGFVRAQTYITELLNDTDVLLLQETWLLDVNLGKLSSLHPDFLAIAKSGVDATRAILPGRPSGGVAVLYHKKLAKNVKAVSFDSRRVCGMSLTLNSSVKLLLLCLYMPCDNYSTLSVNEDYETVINEVECYLNANHYDSYIIGGDFNTCFARLNSHTGCLKSFMERNTLHACWDSTKTIVSDTYVNHALNHASRIDHFLLCDIAFQCIDKCEVRYDATNPSNHNVLFLALDFQYHDCSSAAINSGSSASQRPSSTDWCKAHPDAVGMYRQYLDTLLSTLLQRQELPLCSDVSCNNAEHRASIDSFCSELIENCLLASSLCIPTKHHGRKPVAGWDERARPERETALLWHWIWKDCGRPRQGTVYEIMKRTRHRYHYTVRMLKRNETEEKRRILAAKIGHRDLWEELNKINPKLRASPPCIDDAVGDDEIANHFASKFESLYTSVPTDEQDISELRRTINSGLRDNPSHAHMCTAPLLQKCLLRLKRGKHDPLSGLDSDHLINGPLVLLTALSHLYNAMIVHGHTPDCLLRSTIIAIPKNTNASLCSSDNYRGIALASSICKLFDLLIIELYADKLSTSDLQFGFKPRVSTTMCTAVLLETVSYFTTRGSDVYCCLLDASRAFDRVHFGRLFKLLIQRGLPMPIIRVLLDSYSRQRSSAAQGSARSRDFSAANGVKQGGVLSPLLFTVYFDELLLRLQRCGAGCTISHRFIGALAYADDVTLLAPNLLALNKMIACCQEFADEYNVIFNGRKTVCTKFGSPRTPYDILFVDNVEVKWVEKCTHLGNSVNTNLDDSSDCTVKLSHFFGFVNKTIANFGFSSNDTLAFLFNTYCCSFYGSQIWALNSRNVKHVCTQWNKAVRRILHLPFTTHRWLLPILAKRPPLQNQLETRFLKFISSMFNSDNNIVSFISNFAFCCRNSVLGNNIAYIEYCRNVDFTSSLSTSVNIVNDSFVPCEEELAIAQAVRELSDRTLSIDFTDSERKFFRFSLCTD